MNTDSDTRIALVDRVKNILLKPADEWTRIDAEPDSIGGIYRRYAIPLAAIPAIAGLIGGLVFGHSAFGITYRPSVIGAVGGAVVQYVLALAGIFVLALIIDALAPSFQATRNRVQAFKVAAYSATAGWVAGVFALLPPIAFLSILGLYSLYLLYLGLPKLMKAPAEKALSYTIVVIVAAIVVFLVIGALTAPLARLVAGPAHIADNGKLSGTLAVPGVGSVDVGKLEDASKKMEAAAQKMQSGVGTQPLPASTLEGLLPASLAGLDRTEVESSSAGTGGVGGSRAEAHYGSGDKTASLEITDLASISGLAALGSAFNVESSRKTATGYEKTGKVDGRMTTEEWDSQSRHGKYGVLVGERFMVEANGDGLDINTLKTAVAGLDLAALEKTATAAAQ